MSDFAEQFAKHVGVSVEPQEVAEPVIEKEVEPIVQEPSVEKDAEPEHKEDTEQIDNGKERDFEKDSAFAKIRREKEKLEKQLKEQQDERDRFYAEQFAEHGIKTEAEYREALQKQKQQELIESAQEGDATAIDQLADMKAQEKANEALAKKEQELKLKEELFELNKEFDLTFKSIDELYEIEKGHEIVSIMGTRKPNGEFFSAAEAYKMANVDKLIEMATKKAAQTAKNEKNGYDHAKIDAGKSVDSPDITLSSEVQAEFEKWGMKPNMELLKKLK